MRDPTAINYENQDDFDEELEESENPEDTIENSDEFDDEIDLPETQQPPDDSMDEEIEEGVKLNAIREHEDEQELESFAEKHRGNDSEVKAESMIVEALDDSEVFVELEASASDLKPEIEEKVQLDQSEIVYQPQDHCQTSEYLEDSKAEQKSHKETDKIVNLKSSEPSSKDKEATNANDSQDSTKSFDISATQQSNGESLTSLDENCDNVNIPETEQLMEDESKVEEADESLNNSAADSSTVDNANDTTMFSETDFSRVDIDSCLLASDTEGGLKVFLFIWWKMSQILSQISEILIIISKLFQLTFFGKVLTNIWNFKVTNI